MKIPNNLIFCAAALLLALLAQGAPEQTAMQTATAGPIRPVSQTAMATKRDPGNHRHLMSLSRMHNADVKNVVDTATTTSATSTTASADTTAKATSIDTANNADVTATPSAAQATDTTNNADHYGLGGWGRGYYSYPNYHYHSYSGLGHRHHHHGWRRLLAAK